MNVDNQENVPGAILEADGDMVEEIPVEENPVLPFTFTTESFEGLIAHLMIANIQIKQKKLFEMSFGTLLSVCYPGYIVEGVINSFLERVLFLHEILQLDNKELGHIVCIIDIKRNSGFSIKDANRRLDRFIRGYFGLFQQDTTRFCCSLHTRYYVRYKNRLYTSVIPLGNVAYIFLLRMRYFKFLRNGIATDCFPQSQWNYTYVYMDAKEMLHLVPIHKTLMMSTVPYFHFKSLRVTDLRRRKRHRNIEPASSIEFWHTLELNTAKYFDSVKVLVRAFTSFELSLELRQLIWNENVDLPFEQKGCEVCLEEYNNGDDVIQILSCGHVWHNNCFRQLFDLFGQWRCPKCRQKLLTLTSNDNYINIFNMLNREDTEITRIMDHGHNPTIFWHSTLL